MVRASSCFSLPPISHAAQSPVRTLGCPFSSFLYLRHLGGMTRPWMGNLGLYGSRLLMVGKSRHHLSAPR